MKKLCQFVYIGLIGLLAIKTTQAQTAPFSGRWSFEGNDGGTSSNSFIALSAVNYHGVNKFPPNPYTTGYNNLSVNVQNWSTTVCNNTEYVEFTAQSLGTAKLTLTSLTFAFARSMDGPRQLTVRSSVDGFGADIYTTTVTESYQVASVSFGSSAYVEQSGPITFRIYGCNPISGGATLKLDEIQFNGSSLPVTLLSFTAKPEGDRVQLAWTTTSEQDADRFIVERSADLREFVAVDEVAAKGTTDTRQHYGLTDKQPQPGINYYRLKQIDFDGTTHTYKPVSAIIRTDEPAVAVHPNPADAERIHLRLWNADDAVVRLLTLTGQVINSRLECQSSEVSLVPEQALQTGLYIVEVWTKGQRRISKVLIR